MSFRAVLVVFLLGAACVPGVRAQDSKLNTNLGMGVSVPLNPTAALVGAGVQAVIGAGYNFDKHHSIIGQFMWSGLPVNKDALRPIWIVAGDRGIDGRSSIIALTANYRFQLQGKVFGVYAIGGGGLYYRHAKLTKEVDVGTGTVCGPSWQYWGYGCVSGVVSQDQTLVSAGSTAFGGNAGVGFTIKITDDGYRFYVESRYHYAPTKNLSTTFIPITLGFSW